MKKRYLLLILFVLIPALAFGSDVLDFAEDTSPTSDDIVYVIDAPATVPADKKATLGNAITKAHGMTGSDYYITLDGSNVMTAITNPNILKSVITGEGVVTGSGASTPAFVAKGANNTIYGVNNAGVMGFYSSMTPVLTSAPADDDTYTGTIASFVAGEALAQWDVVYCKNKAGVHACYKYDRNGADKAMPPRYMATAAISADASGVFLVSGIVRNDGWAMTTNQDEGVLVYASTTAGGIDLTKSSTAADIVAILGYVIEQNVVHFNPSPILVEVP